MALVETPEQKAIREIEKNIDKDGRTTFYEYDRMWNLSGVFSAGGQFKSIF